MKKKIALGADHGGFRLKERLKVFLSKKGYSVNDFGAFDSASSDYPLVAHKVSKAVSLGRFKKGILLCKSGIGMAIMANKLPGVRAAVCRTVKDARSSRLHNDANVLSLAAEYTRFDKARKIVNAWLSTEAEGGRHKRRVEQISKLERK